MSTVKIFVIIEYKFFWTRHMLHAYRNDFQRNFSEFSEIDRLLHLSAIPFLTWGCGGCSFGSKHLHTRSLYCSSNGPGLPRKDMVWTRRYRTHLKQHMLFRGWENVLMRNDFLYSLLSHTEPGFYLIQTKSWAYSACYFFNLVCLHSCETRQFSSGLFDSLDV